MKLIIIEGIDGAGKTTLIKNLTQKLKTLQIPYQVFQGLGSSSIGTQIRNIFLSSSQLTLSTRFYLSFSNMVQIQKECLEPYIDTKTILILDRWLPSTYAYQIYPNLKEQKEMFYLKNIFDWTCSQLTELVSFNFLLDLDPQQSLKRKEKQKNHHTDWIEQQPLSYFQLVRKGYFKYFQEYQALRSQILNGEDTVDTNTEIILEYLNLRKKDF